MGRVRILSLLALVVALLQAPAALAQLRTIPAEAKRGQLQHVQGMLVEIDGNRVLLPPSAQIRGPDNLIVLPAALEGRVPVKYLRDLQGQVHRIWILTREEAAKPDPRK